MFPHQHKASPIKKEPSWLCPANQTSQPASQPANQNWLVEHESLMAQNDLVTGDTLPSPPAFTPNFAQRASRFSGRWRAKWASCVHSCRTGNGEMCKWLGGKGRRRVGRGVADEGDSFQWREVRGRCPQEPLTWLSPDSLLITPREHQALRLIMHQAALESAAILNRDFTVNRGLTTPSGPSELLQWVWLII